MDDTGKDIPLGTVKKELRKRMIMTLVITVFLCGVAMGIGMILAGFYKYGSYSFSLITLIFTLMLIFVFLIRMLVTTLVESNRLWEIYKSLEQK